MLIALSSCSTEPKPKRINNFCELFEPLPQETKEVYDYTKTIYEKLELNQIKKPHEKFAVFVLNNLAINYQKYDYVCIQGKSWN